MAFLATPLLIYFAYETILKKNFISFSDVKETEKLNFFFYLFDSEPNVEYFLLFFYFPHVQLSTIDPGVFFEQSKSTCHNDALQQILYWFLRRKYSTLGSESNR
jgi:hypothetical protein